MPNTEHGPCLVLNQDYTALTIINWRRAICQQIIGKEFVGEGLRALEYYKEDYITSAGGDHFPVMAVSITNRYINMNRKVPLCKKNLVIRDKSTCQYCGLKLSGKNVTIDHVIPKSRFQRKVEANTWDNVVVSCHDCNNRKKRDQTPQQANMTLLSTPKMPSYSNLFFMNLKNTYNIPKEWEVYV